VRCWAPGSWRSVYGNPLPDCDQSTVDGSTVRPFRSSTRNFILFKVPRSRRTWGRISSRRRSGGTVQVGLSTRYVISERNTGVLRKVLPTCTRVVQSDFAFPNKIQAKPGDVDDHELFAYVVQKPAAALEIEANLIDPLFDRNVSSPRVCAVPRRRPREGRGVSGTTSRRFREHHRKHLRNRRSSPHLRSRQAARGSPELGNPPVPARGAGSARDMPPTSLLLEAR
jgi:hypothetical protein